MFAFPPAMASYCVTQANTVVCLFPKNLTGSETTFQYSWTCPASLPVNCSLTVFDFPTITQCFNDVARVGVPYQSSLVAVGGSSLSFTLTSSQVPGASLWPNGTLDGSFLAEGDYALTVIATDTSTNPSCSSFSLVCPLHVVNGPYVRGVIGTIRQNVAKVSSFTVDVLLGNTAVLSVNSAVSWFNSSWLTISDRSCVSTICSFNVSVSIPAGNPIGTAWVQFVARELPSDSLSAPHNVSFSVVPPFIVMTDTPLPVIVDLVYTCPVLDTVGRGGPYSLPIPFSGTPPFDFAFIGPRGVMFSNWIVTVAVNDPVSTQVLFSLSVNNGTALSCALRLATPVPVAPAATPLVVSGDAFVDTSTLLANLTVEVRRSESFVVLCSKSVSNRGI